MPRTKSRRRGRPSAIAKLSVSQLMEEIERRRSMAGELHARRAELERDLAAVTSELAELASLGGMDAQAAMPASAPKRGRPKGSGKSAGRGGAGRDRGGNEQSLSALLQSLLKGRTLSVPEMADAAIKAGYKSKSKNFRTIIGLTILKNKKSFHRVSRGQYTAR